MIIVKEREVTKMLTREECRELYLLMEENETFFIDIAEDEGLVYSVATNKGVFPCMEYPVEWDDNGKMYIARDKGVLLEKGC